MLDQRFIVRCKNLTQRLYPAIEKRIGDLDNIRAKVRSNTLRNAYEEAWVHTYATGAIGSRFLRAVIAKLDVQQQSDLAGSQGDILQQKIDAMGADLAISSLENLLAVIEVSSLRSLKKILRTIASQAAAAAIPWMDLVINVDEILNSLSSPFSEADKVLMELDAFEFAALNAATWVVGQVAALTEPPNEKLLELPLDEAARVAAAAARGRVDAIVSEVRRQLATGWTGLESIMEAATEKADPSLDSAT